MSHVLLNGNPTAGYNRLLHVSFIPGENRLLSCGVQASWTRRQGHVLPHFSDNDMTCGTHFGAISCPSTSVGVCISDSFGGIHGSQFDSKEMETMRSPVIPLPEVLDSLVLNVSHGGDLCF